MSHCSEGYKTVGMQSLITIIRGTGATNVLQVPGVQYANSMTHFLDAGIRPTDTLALPQLAADVDVYPNGDSCGSTSCFDSEYAPVAAQMPFMFGEFGESVSGSDCTVTGVNALMSWADQHGAGYSAWDWDTWGGCLQLITDYTTGNPNGNWGNAYKNHLAALPLTMARPERLRQPPLPVLSERSRCFVAGWSCAVRFGLGPSRERLDPGLAVVPHVEREGVSR